MSAITFHERFKEEFRKIEEHISKNETELLKKFFEKKVGSLDELAVKVVLWGHVFMPEYFSRKSPEVHYDLVKRFFSNRNEYTALPRGYGKTTLLQACVCFSVAHGLDEFIVLIEKTYNEAAEVLEAVRDEFKFNDFIIVVYGDLTKISQRGKEDQKLKDTTGDFFVNGVRLRGKGFDAPIRGIKSRHTRPTRIVLDDVESDEHIENPEQRHKYLMNYLKGILPAESVDGGSIKVQGTILHDDSLLSVLIKEHDGKIYRAWDEDKNLLWPEVWTVERLEKKRAEMALEGEGDVSFYQEYFNEPVPKELQVFRKDMFRYFNDFQLQNEILKKPCRTYMMIDPAISKKNRADFTAMVCVVVDSFNRIYVAEIMRARMNPLEIFQGLVAMYERWRPFKVGIESVVYQKALVFYIEEKKRESESLIRQMQIQELRTDTDKVRRIGQMQNRYALGTVFHRENDAMTKMMESELIRFPKGANDDIIDALSNINQMLVPMIEKTSQITYSKWRRGEGGHRQVAY